MRRFAWEADGCGGWIASMPGGVTLCVSPNRTRGAYPPKPARGTSWRAQASRSVSPWEIRRYGRDEYNIRWSTRAEAMRAAERLYLDAVAEAEKEI